MDGHNLEDLITILKEVKATESVGPVLIHVVTEKGKGYFPAENAQVRSLVRVMEVVRRRTLLSSLFLVERQTDIDALACRRTSTTA